MGRYQSLTVTSNTTTKAKKSKSWVQNQQKELVLHASGQWNTWNMFPTVTMKKIYGCKKKPGKYCINRQMPDKPYTTPQQIKKPLKITYSDLSCRKRKYPVHGLNSITFLLFLCSALSSHREPPTAAFPAWNKWSVVDYSVLWGRRKWY